MNIDFIIEKPDSTPLSTDEMVFVVEQYIKEKKGQAVEINPLKRLDPNHPFFPMQCQQKIKMLHEAYNVAKSYFKNK